MELLRSGCVVCRGPGPAVCGPCLRATEAPPSTRVRTVGPVPAAFAYAGSGARIVQALKYRDGRRAVPVLADLLADLTPPRGGEEVPTAVTWVATTAGRRRARGFDQAELLARALARRLGLPAVDTLRRRRGPAQTGLDRAARQHMAGFRARSVPGPVLVVDDVCTTGATLRAAAAALGDAGTEVAGWRVVARTP